MPRTTTVSPMRTNRSGAQRDAIRAWIHDPAVQVIVAAVRLRPASVADWPRQPTRVSAT